MIAFKAISPGNLLGAAVVVVIVASLSGTLAAQSGGSWRFAFSGDSRNCGDVVMPAIAAGAKAGGAAFFWHLGDDRATYDFDQDYRALHPKATIAQYEAQAWPDFIEHQLNPFGNMPVYLAIGNHETIPPHSRVDWMIQFADWLLTPTIEAQRLADDASDHQLRTYYHWIERGVDFITLDNATPDQFDSAQLAWLQKVLSRDTANPAVRSVVLGMHEALPDSISSGHSMNESPAGTQSGRQVYTELLQLQQASGKHVYVLASHSHFVMSNVYATACRKPQDVLSGWIVGTGGAVRYRLPKDLAGSGVHQTDVYGYALATVGQDGNIEFEFKQINPSDIPPATVQEFGQATVDACFSDNKTEYVPRGAVCEKQ
ncbi:MAG TPA: metallophosphoesterase [Terriglobia bacterium]|nr:metallophosphoesterase [Terriglobia bacterium]